MCLGDFLFPALGFSMFMYLPGNFPAHYVSSTYESPGGCSPPFYLTHPKLIKCTITSPITLPVIGDVNVQLHHLLQVMYR